MLDTACKGAAILLLTFIATLAMRRASAAVRHLVWFLGTFSLLLLPILSAALPGWGILPKWSMKEIAIVQPTAAPMIISETVPAPVPAVPDIQLMPNYTPPAPQMPRIEKPLPAPATITPIAEAAQLPIHLNWQSWVLIAWLPGSVLYLAYLVVACVSLHRLQRRSSRITSTGWLTHLSQVRNQLGFHRPVQLIGCPDRAMPMTWGLWRTWILLPDASADWTEAQCRAVLLHEVAHARRLDCLTQLFAHLARAMYWFNPLVWLAYRKMQIEREQACDDLVLSTGTRASVYAEQLLQIAAEMPALRYSAAAISMARPGTLEGRLLAILDVKRNRRAMTGSAGVIALILMSAIAAPLAMLRGQEVTKVQPAVAAPSKISEVKPRNGMGHVVDVHGQPIANALVRQDGGTWTGVTDQDGWVALPAMKDETPESFTITATGFARLVQDFWLHANGEIGPNGGAVQLHRSGRLEGTILRHDGKPLPGAPLSISVKYSEGGWMSDALQTISDEQGHFVVDDVPPGDMLLEYPWLGPSNIDLKAGRWKKWIKPGQTCPSIPTEGGGTAIALEMTEGQIRSDLVLDLSKSIATAQGRVVDHVGKPLSNAQVYLCWQWPTGSTGACSQGIPNVKTDAQGRYTLEKLPIGNWHLEAAIGNAVAPPVPVVLSATKADAPDMVLPVELIASGRVRRVYPMDPADTVREWIDATTAGDIEGAAAMVVSDSAMQRSSDRITGVLRQITSFPTYTEGSDGQATATTNQVTFGDGHRSQLFFTLTGKSGSWRISRWAETAPGALMGDPTSTAPAPVLPDTQPVSVSPPGNALPATIRESIPLFCVTPLADRYVREIDGNAAVTFSHNIDPSKCQFAAMAWDSIGEAHGNWDSFTVAAEAGAKAVLRVSDGIDQVQKTTIRFRDLRLGDVSRIAVIAIPKSTDAHLSHPTILLETGMPTGSLTVNQITINSRDSSVLLLSNGLRIETDSGYESSRSNGGLIGFSLRGGAVVSASGAKILYGVSLEYKSPVPIAMVDSPQLPAMKHSDDAADFKSSYQRIAAIDTTMARYLLMQKHDQLALQGLQTQGILSNHPTYVIEQKQLLNSEKRVADYADDYNRKHGEQLPSSAPATDQHATLDFRIAACIDQNIPAATGNRLPADLAQKYISDLEKNGPHKVDGFDWFEAGKLSLNPFIVSGTHDGKQYVLLATADPSIMLAERTGERTWGLTHIGLDKNQAGDPVINFELDSPGAKRFGKLTEENIKQPLAMLVDDKVLCIATIQTKIISGAMIMLNKDFDPAVAKQIVQSLSLGMPPATQPAAADDNSIELWGQVVDDRTGDPIEKFSIQRGIVDRKDPSKVGWGGEQSTPVWKDGTFQIKYGVVPGGSAWNRILSSGYLPEPITPSPVKGPTVQQGMIVRMKRGADLRGQVLDFTGKPVADAQVIAVGDQGLTLDDGRHSLGNYQGSNTTTGNDGRFILASGLGKRVIVSAQTLFAYLVPASETNGDVTIHLPQPAAVTVHYEIDGSSATADIRAELETWDMPDWKDLQVNVVHHLKCPQGGEISATNLAPGTYDMSRYINLSIGDAGGGYFGDRTNQICASGQNVAVDFVRKIGQRVRGKVTGLQGTDIAGAIIFVRALGATGNVMDAEDWKHTYFDGQVCKKDGEFQTARLSPGKYTVLAEAYKEEKNEPGNAYADTTGWRMPTLVASTVLVVPENGDAKPIQLDLKTAESKPVPEVPGAEGAALPANEKVQAIHPGSQAETAGDFDVGIIGDVGSPGTVRIPKSGLVLKRLLADAKASGTDLFISVVRGGQITLKRVPLADILDDLTPEFRMQGGDIVLASRSADAAAPVTGKPSTPDVYVFGDVRRIGVYSIRKNPPSTLRELVVGAGVDSSERNVRRLRGGLGTDFRLMDLIDGKSSGELVEPGDIIQVVKDKGSSTQGSAQTGAEKDAPKEAATRPTQPSAALNADQQLVLDWTNNDFRQFFDARKFTGWSDQEKQNLEDRCIDALSGPQNAEYYRSINTLSALDLPKALPNLREIAFDRRDKNNRDRWMAIRALGLMGDKASVPQLIHLVYHGNTNTHWWAQISLVRLTGQNFGSDWNAWGNWWNACGGQTSGGQPVFDPQIIKWWNGQAAEDQLAKTLADQDRQFLTQLRGGTPTTDISR